LDELRRYERGSFEDCLRGCEGTPHIDDPSKHAFSILDRRSTSINFKTRSEAITLLASIENSFDILANHAIDNSIEEGRRIRPMLRSIQRIMNELRKYIEEGIE
jgi:hypothetical protein